MKTEPRLIKKYPNRRLYDTGESRYIKLKEVRELIEEGVPIKVVDSQSEEDITRSILLQIILEQESNQQPLFTTENLENFIRYYGDNSREGFMYFMEKNLEFFQQQQEQVQKQFKDFMGLNPLDFWTEQSRNNMDLWNQFQENFLGSSGENKRDKS